MAKEETEAIEKQFKKKYGLLEMNLTPEEAYAIRSYIEALDEAIGYYVQAGLVTKNQVDHLTKYKNDDYQRGYNKLLGIGGTSD